MIDVTTQLPDDLGASLGETPGDHSRRVLEYTAVEAYRSGLITHRPVGELSGLDYWETVQFLRALPGANGIWNGGPGGGPGYLGREIGSRSPH